jgi:hypothetical protein
MNEELIRKDVQVAVAAAFHYLRQHQIPGNEGRANYHFDVTYNTAPVVLPPL